MTRNRTLTTLAGMITAVAVAAPGSAATQATPGTCTVDFARSALESGAADSLCGCSTVTQGFVMHLQRHSDFADLLSMYDTTCPGLAAVLGDVPTATIRATGSGNGVDVTSAREERWAEEQEDNGTTTTTSDDDDNDGADGKRKKKKEKKIKKKKNKEQQSEHRGDRHSGPNLPFGEGSVDS